MKSQDPHKHQEPAVPVDELIEKTRTRRLLVRRPKTSFQGMPLRDVRLKLSQPPGLEGAEEVLEKNLARQMHRDYTGMDWWERTWEFSQVWDHVRRRRLALLSSSFDQFRPRWKDPAWDDFNQGRRQADAHGARYEPWIRAVFKSMPGQDVPPSRLHGEAAIRAYSKYAPPDEPTAAPQPAPDEPLADQVAEILAMAEDIYGDDPLAGVKLIRESIQMGVLPPEAVDTLPQRLRFAYHQEYLKQDGAGAMRPPAPAVGVDLPKIII